MRKKTQVLYRLIPSRRERDGTNFCCRTHTINPRFAHLIIPSSPPSNSKISFLEGKRARHELEREERICKQFLSLSLSSGSAQSSPLLYTTTTPLRAPPPPPNPAQIHRRDPSPHHTGRGASPLPFLYSLPIIPLVPAPPRPALKTRNPERARTRISRAH
jgi:hypothetical protein